MLAQLQRACARATTTDEGRLEPTTILQNVRNTGASANRCVFAAKRTEAFKYKKEFLSRESEEIVLKRCIPARTLDANKRILLSRVQEEMQYRAITSRNV